MRKIIAILFLLVGVVLMVTSVLLAVQATSAVNVIGGTGVFTFRFVFFYKNRGLYASLFFLGIAAEIISVILFVRKRKNK